MNKPTALLADDEDLPRAELRRMLASAWPDLQIVAELVKPAASLFFQAWLYQGLDDASANFLNLSLIHI